MANTPNIDLAEYPTGSLQPSAPYNDAMQVIDALMRPGGIIEDKDLTTPPTTVADDAGKRWIIPTGATGAWAGREDQIALCTAATVWRYFVPTEGWRVYILDENLGYTYGGGSSGWISDGSGLGDVVGPASSTNDAVALFDGTTGKLLKDGSTIATIRTIPQNSQSAAYTLVLTDAGKHILHPSADTTARIFTIPANSSVAFVIGTAVTFVNQNAAGVITIAITTDTMRLAGAGTTGSRTLAANGIATALKITSTEWIISGTGLT